MSKTRWAVDGPDGTILELNGRKFSSDDEGAPMMCNIVCRDMGRHAHLDYCRTDPGDSCGGQEVQHIGMPLKPNPDLPKDWVSHSLYWKRSGAVICLLQLKGILVTNYSVSLGFKGEPLPSAAHFNFSSFFTFTTPDPYSRDDQTNFAKW